MTRLILKWIMVCGLTLGSMNVLAQESFSTLTQRAENGDAEAQFQLGLIYANGRGVPVDLDQAMMWYCRSALQGFPKAQNNLGVMYSEGEGIEKNYQIAAYWFRKSANQGFAQAQLNLSLMNSPERGQLISDVEAFLWCRKAALLGMDSAQSLLSTLYYDRYTRFDHRTESLVRAYAWGTLAAKQGVTHMKDLLVNYEGYMSDQEKGWARDEIIRITRLVEQASNPTQASLGVTTQEQGRAGRYALGKSIPELHLANGKVLRSVTVVSVGSSHLMAKWEDGRGSIPVDLLPPDVSAAFSAIKSQESVSENGVTLESEGELTVENTLSPVEERNKELRAKLTEFDAKEAVDAAKVLAQPTPLRPPYPDALKGSVGKTGGPDKIIQGQVFITSKDGINYKLGAVGVRLFGLREYLTLREKVGIALKPTRNYLDAMANRASARKQSDLAIQYLEECSSLFDTELGLYPKGPTTDTDAEGHFEIRHNLEEPYVLVVLARRNVGKKVERYGWEIPSGRIGSDGKILLTNNNVKQ